MAEPCVEFKDAPPDSHAVKLKVGELRRLREPLPSTVAAREQPVFAQPPPGHKWPGLSPIAP
jgi:hypothetical protein